MTINLYLASFDTCHEWPGRWFEISSLEDLRDAVSVCNSFGVEEIEVCDFEGDFRFEDIGGNFMLNFLFYHFEVLEEIYETIEPRVVRDYFLQTYQIDEILSAYSNSSIDIIDRGESILSDAELVGYYFADIIDFHRIPGIFRDYFDYEAYGRDIIIGGTYEILESDSCLYLIS